MAVLLRSGTRCRPNWITSDGVICARRWNTLLCRKSLIQCSAGWRPSILAGVQDQVARHSSEDQRNHQQHHQRQAGMQERMLVEGTPEVLDVEPELFDIHGQKRFFCKTRWAIRAFKTLCITLETNRATKKQLISAVCIKKLGLSARNR